MREMNDKWWNEIEQLRRDMERLKTQGGTGKWTAYTPTFGGFSADPVVVARYFLVGKVCTAVISNTTAGTSNANTFTISAPFTAATVADMIWVGAMGVHRSGGIIYGGGVVKINSAGTVFNCATSTGYSGWATSGDKSAQFSIIYEVA